MNKAKALLFSGVATLGMAFAAHAQNTANDDKLIAMNDAPKTEVVAETKRNMGKEAHEYSASGKGIGIYVLAGNEFNGMTDAQINEMFDKMMKKSGIDVEAFVERNKDNRASLFRAYVDGDGIGAMANAKAFKENLQAAVNKYRSNRSVAANADFN